MVQLIMIVLESFNQDLNTFHEFGLLTLFVCVCLCGRGREGGGDVSLGHLMDQIILS